MKPTQSPVARAPFEPRGAGASETCRGPAPRQSGPSAALPPRPAPAATAGSCATVAEGQAATGEDSPPSTRGPHRPSARQEGRTPSSRSLRQRRPAPGARRAPPALGLRHQSDSKATFPSRSPHSPVPGPSPAPGYSRCRHITPLKASLSWDWTCRQAHRSRTSKWGSRGKTQARFLRELLCQIKSTHARGHHRSAPGSPPPPAGTWRRVAAPSPQGLGLRFGNGEAGVGRSAARGQGPERPRHQRAKGGGPARPEGWAGEDASEAWEQLSTAPHRHRPSGRQSSAVTPPERRPRCSPAPRTPVRRWGLHRPRGQRSRRGGGRPVSTAVSTLGPAPGQNPRPEIPGCLVLPPSFREDPPSPPWTRPSPRSSSSEHAWPV